MFHRRPPRSRKPKKLPVPTTPEGLEKKRTRPSTPTPIGRTTTQIESCHGYLTGTSTTNLESVHTSLPTTEVPDPIVTKIIGPVSVGVAKPLPYMSYPRAPYRSLGPRFHTNTRFNIHRGPRSCNNERDTTTEVTGSTFV